MRHFFKNSNGKLCIHYSSDLCHWYITNNFILILIWYANNEFNQSWIVRRFHKFLIDDEDLRYVDDLSIYLHAIRYQGTGGRTFGGISARMYLSLKESSRIISFLWDESTNALDVDIREVLKNTRLSRAEKGIVNVIGWVNWWNNDYF